MKNSNSTLIPGGLDMYGVRERAERASVNATIVSAPELTPFLPHLPKHKTQKTQKGPITTKNEPKKSPKNKPKQPKTIWPNSLPD